MGQSYRIKTELGVNKTINLQLDQDFEFLEILSLKIQQTDVYTRSCADYGVLVGRVVANGGFGVPNARVSVFIPITVPDQSNPLISSIYPYKSPTDKNEDGYRYNLLPYEKSYSKHAATGTLPSRIDSLTGSTAIEIYDKYYKFTAKTNESGDYMIMGVPLGNQTIVMDVDLSDIGEFSLTPQDLIRMGLATEAQVAGNKFRTSTDLKSLPQIINIVKSAEISPLWGDPTTCQIAVNRLDFDLRDEANVDIQPTSVFMGSMFSSPDSYRVRKDCRPRDDMGNLCGLTTSPGQILAIRQTIQQDSDGNPVLEQYDLEQAGNVIDGSGTWLIEVPMNLEYYITNEFGEKVISYDPTIGIPTKGKYRFKIKWTQPNDLTLPTRRPYFLVPNVKEYGWLSSSPDITPPNGIPTSSRQKQQQSSYYFGLAWSGYTNGFSGQEQIDKLNESIDCDDTFYQFEFNRVYTVSSLFDQWKKGGSLFGGQGKFIGIKEIDSQDCEDSVNKFPVNDGFKNFDLLYFLFSIIFTVLQPVGLILLTVAHILIFLYNLLIQVICWICDIRIPVIKVRPFSFICRELGISCDKKDYTIRLPMITYPDCQACECNQDLKTTKNLPTPTNAFTGGGILSLLSQSSLYEDQLETLFGDDVNAPEFAYMFGQAVAGNGNLSAISQQFAYKLPISVVRPIFENTRRFIQTYDLPVGERINIFNQRRNYFTGINQIKVTIAKELNIGKHHYDNTITVLSQEEFPAGTLLTFVNPSGSTDYNYNYSATTTGGTITGISGESYNSTGATSVNVSYAIDQLTNSAPVTYNLPYGSGETNYKFPADIEYYQVITAITVANASKIWNTQTTQSFGQILSAPTNWTSWEPRRISFVGTRFVPGNSGSLISTVYFEDYQQQYVLVLQRGVDPYSPLYRNEYRLGNLFGTNENDSNWIVTADTRLNIPIQKLTNPTISVQGYSQPEMFYQSYFFKPGTTTQPIPGQSFTGYNTTNTAYYGRLNGTSVVPGALTTQTVIPNPGFTGGARRIRYSIVSYTNPALVCGDPFNTTDSLFVANTLANATPVIGLRLNQDYTQAGTGVYSNPLNGLGRWWKLNWGGAYYRVQINSLGYITAFNSCDTYLTSVGELFAAPTNAMYDYYTNPVKYDNEDLSGLGVMTQTRPPVTGNGTPYVGSPLYDFQAFYSTFIYTSSYNTTNPIFVPMTISTSQLNVLRTDMLPSSDQLDGGSWDLNPALLQQNLNFAVYVINTIDDDLSTVAFSVGAETVTVDLEGYGELSVNVLESFNCENMVGLDCYVGFGTQFTIDTNCITADAVENGCYMFLRRPLSDLLKDWKNFGEWGYRFRFFYALCRGVLSQSFMNNWINGALYAFPLQVDTYYNNQNKPEYPRFCSGIAYFNTDSNNFYYRSSPWNNSSKKFIGYATGNPAGLNDRNLLFPTTIINLGMKDYFYSEITFDPTTKAYIIPNLDSTSYGDTSDLVNLFVISRITDETFLQQIIDLGDNGINQLFTRPQKRIDGDFTQLASINCEIGNINFSPQYYATIVGDTDPPVNVLGSAGDPAMAVWFSSTTQDLQTKDYLTPGVIDFRSSDNLGYYPYPYGIKSQLVPFYQWELRGSTGGIFGNQDNNWATGSSGIIQNNYQSLDRTATNTKYFLNGTSVANDLTARAYIFQVDGDRVNYPTTGGKYTWIPDASFKNKFLVGAPFQFYFGPVKGASALDRFKTKYSVDE
jgi:hypothetical protein